MYNEKLVSVHPHTNDPQNVARVKVPLSGEGYYVQVEYWLTNEVYILDVFLELEDAQRAAEGWTKNGE